MNICFSTLGCPGYDLDQVIALARKYRIENLEIRGLEGTMELAEMKALDREHIAESRKKLGDIRLLVFGSDLCMDYSVKDEDLIPKGKKLIDGVSSLKIPYIRVFGNMIFEGEDEEKALAAIARRLQILSDYAADKDVQILVETHGNVTTPERIGYLTDHVSSPAFGILWDVAHTDKQFKDDFASFYRPFLPLIRHVHIKDHIRLEEGTRLVRIGEGEIPVGNIVKSLIKDGYQGAFSLEWEKKWHPDLCDLDIALGDYTDLLRSL